MRPSGCAFSFLGTGPSGRIMGARPAACRRPQKRRSSCPCMNIIAGNAATGLRPWSSDQSGRRARPARARNSNRNSPLSPWGARSVRAAHPQIRTAARARRPAADDGSSSGPCARMQTVISAILGPRGSPRPSSAPHAIRYGAVDMRYLPRFSSPPSSIPDVLLRCSQVHDCMNTITYFQGHRGTRKDTDPIFAQHVPAHHAASAAPRPALRAEAAIVRMSYPRSSVLIHVRKRMAAYS